jgi:D-inositol-3-phosphate glycosyltransferase
MRRLAVLSMHTSPLAQPGTGDGGGMNVYVRELSSSLARAGVACDVYTRRFDEDLPDVVNVEPGMRVHHVSAGPQATVPKEELFNYVDEFTAGVLDHMTRRVGPDAYPADAIHVNYWLSGLAGHTVKHELELPLVSTFHTLDRVKAEASVEEVEASEPGRRAQAEQLVIGCSDAVLASCPVEADQLVGLYDADPARIEVVSPGVDHAFFSPGDQLQARRAAGLPEQGELVLFVGRIQPLKGADVAVHTLAMLSSLGHPRARLVVVGGPSGPHGAEEVALLEQLVEGFGLTERVLFVPPQRHELLSTFYRASDICLVPSRSESFGLVALEAAACGAPVVASAVGGLTMLVDDGVTGFLVEAEQTTSAERAAGFAARVAELLDDAAMASQMSKAAAERARGYTWPIAAARLRRLYGDLTARALVECA